MKKIFLVEDDEYVSRMYERSFRLRGYEIEIAYDGEKASQALSSMNPPPSAILLDIMIPKKDGAAVLRDIRANTLFDNIPVVILTNSLHTEDAEKFLSLGADLYLIKMDNQSKEIVEKVEALINKGRTK